MDKISSFGSISHQEKEKIFNDFVLVLLKDRVDFVIRNIEGDFNAITLLAPSIGLEHFELAIDSKMSSSKLMWVTEHRNFMVNSMEDLMLAYKDLMLNSKLDVMDNQNYSKGR